ncbi:hypothetical protein BN946_scf184941.g29 [Trametes cinnabarina]|uniref:Uncharacterized protein n=1 Tax=Pycnoporus cinnabarinus TaxID=5643 RepID=A0A060SNC5_PYCCI|nr:hypothetical protein BN946_scf184941.g29 [Trametes cinnabarina]
MLRISLILCLWAAFATAVLGLELAEKRDDNLPARVPYVFPPPGADPIADALRARRPNGTLLDLDGVLLQDDNLAAGWNALATMIRDNNTIPATMRELMHEPAGRQAGLSPQQLQEIRLTPAFSSPLAINTSLTPELSAAMLFTDFMTEAINVPQPVFDGLHRFLSDKQIVDAVATVGTYNLVSRFVVALNVDSKMDVPVPIPTQ